MLRLANAQNWSVPETIGKLHIFWWWCLDYATDGRLAKFDAGTIGHVFGVNVDVEKFVQSLIDIELLDSAPEIRVHDWWDYAGRFLQVRYKRTPKTWKEIKRFYGFTVQRTNNRTTTGQSAINNHKPNQPNLTKPDLTNQPNQPLLNSCDDPVVVARGVELVDPVAATKVAVLVWESYVHAYVQRYETEPIRNARVNGQITQYIKRVPHNVAPAVAAYYVRHNDAYYVRSRHPLGLLLKDAEGLHTQWITGNSVTRSQAMQVDKTQGRANVFLELINERKRDAEVCNVEIA